MTSSTALPRPPALSESGSPRARPRTDLELAAEAWRFVNRQVQRVRGRRAKTAAAAAAATVAFRGKGSKQEDEDADADADAGSVWSEAETVVVSLAREGAMGEMGMGKAKA